MSKDSNQRDGFDVGVNEAGVSKETHAEWVKHKSFTGGHTLADDHADKNRGSTSEKGKGADGPGTGTFNESVRPVK